MSPIDAVDTTDSGFVPVSMKPVINSLLKTSSRQCESCVPEPHALAGNPTQFSTGTFEPEVKDWPPTRSNAASACGPMKWESLVLPLTSRFKLPQIVP